MNMQKICDVACGPGIQEKYLDCGLLMLRVIVGIAFIFHGWPKVSGMEGTVAMFATMGVGTIVTYIASYVEFIGGILLVLGGATRLVTLLLGVFMLAAIYLVHWDKGYSMMAGGYEYQLLILAVVIFLGIVGPGKYSTHEYICENK